MIPQETIEKSLYQTTEDKAIVEDIHAEFSNDKAFIPKEGTFRDKYISFITSKSPLNSQEEKNLFLQFQNGDEKAKDAIIESNLPLIYAVAEKYVASYPTVDIQDLIGEGVIALCNALRTYNPSFNVPFATYTMRGIEFRMQECILSYRFLIHIPYDVATTMERMIRIEYKYIVQHGIPITLEELSLELGESIERIGYCRELLNYSTADSHDINIDIDHLESEEYADVRLWYESLACDIDCALRTLTPREADFIRKCFGIGQNEKTYEEIGIEYVLTRERVRCIYEKAIRRLKVSQRSRILKTYLGYENNVSEIDTDIDNIPIVKTFNPEIVQNKVKSKEDIKAEKIKRNKKRIEKQIAEIIKYNLNDLPLPPKGIYRNNYLNRLISETRKIIKLLNEQVVSKRKLPSPKMVKIKNKGDVMSHLDKNLGILEQESYVSARTLNELRTNIALLHEKCKSNKK